jgi:hypothetical protein
MAQTPLERDALMDGLMDVFMFGRYHPSATNTFWNEINDDDWISLVLNTEDIHPGGVSSMPAPWQSENDLLFTGSYSLTSKAEFYSDADTSDLVPINKIKVLPYREDQEVPTGATDAATWNP